MTSPDLHTWVIAWAADDDRSRTMTVDEFGRPVPKPFCLCRGRTTRVEQAIERAARVAAVLRCRVTVEKSEKRWWRAAVATLPASILIVEPRHRGTANSILLSLLHVLALDPAARVVLLPSDQQVADEELLAQSIRRSVDVLDPLDARGPLLLLGITPEDADPHVGYIVPRQESGSCVALVAQFVEKPTRVFAERLINAGALWHTGILSASGDALRRAFAKRFPDVVADMAAVVGQNGDGALCSDDLADLYQDLPHIDFSRQILQGAEPLLRVLRIPDCGWSDFGPRQRRVWEVGDESGSIRWVRRD